jgi:hypothetical protein
LFRNSKGTPVDVSFEVVIKNPVPYPDIPLTLPNTPNDILFGFGGDDAINGDAGGGSDGFGNDIIFGDGLAPNDAGTDSNDLLNGERGNDIVFGGANDVRWNLSCRNSQLIDKCREVAIKLSLP